MHSRGLTDGAGSRSAVEYEPSAESLLARAPTRSLVVLFGGVLATAGAAQSAMAMPACACGGGTSHASDSSTRVVAPPPRSRGRPRPPTRRPRRRGTSRRLRFQSATVLARRQAGENVTLKDPRVAVPGRLTLLGRADD
jgi:hypothetical protein